ncbi:MAG: TolC family protein [Alphaproteobacteria bacterium]
MKQYGVIISVCLILSSCTSLPKSVTERNVIQSLSAPAVFKTQQAQDSKIIHGLFDVFQDETLNALVERSLVNNLDIQLAAKQLEEAGFNAQAEWGNILPKLSGNLATNREQGVQGKLQGTYSPSLDVSWEVDVWGKLLNQKESLDATALASVENYQAVQDSIAAQVMQGWFDVVTTEKQVMLEQSRLKNLKRSLENSRRNYESGLGALDDLGAVKRDIAQTKVTLSSNINNHNTAVRVLQVLAGEYPDGKTTLEYNLPALISSPTAGLPADLLTNRPDLRRAWQEVLAADKLVKVAHKDMFPSLSITGALGTQSSAFSDLMSGATIWSLASNMALPLFNAGQLENNMNAAQSRAEQAWIVYLNIALNAFLEVEQALDRETLLADQERQQQEAVIHAENTAKIFEDRYKNGLVSILEYLSAQNTVFDMKSQLLDFRNQRLKNRIALALAIGKGV